MAPQRLEHTQTTVCVSRFPREFDLEPLLQDIVPFEQIQFPFELLCSPEVGHRIDLLRKLSINGGDIIGMREMRTGKFLTLESVVNTAERTLQLLLPHDDMSLSEALESLEFSFWGYSDEIGNRERYMVVSVMQKLVYLEATYSKHLKSSRVRELVDMNDNPKDSYEVEVCAMLSVLEVVENDSGELSHEQILSWHTQLFSLPDTDRGRYRRPDEQVFIRGHSRTFAKGEEVRERMSDVIKFVNATVADNPSSSDVISLSAHVCYQILDIHPFVNGNDRIAHLVASSILCRCKWPLVFLAPEIKGIELAALRMIDRDGFLKGGNLLKQIWVEACYDKLNEFGCGPELNAYLTESDN